LGLTIFWLPTGTLTVSGIPVFNAGVKVLVWIYLAGVLCHLLADTGSRQGCGLTARACSRDGSERSPWFGEYSPHSFRATGITRFLEEGGTLEAAQHMADHADSRTTKLYDRRGQKVLREDVERIRY
jgi:integrase